MRRLDRRRAATAVVTGFALAAAFVAGCDGWDPRAPFERNAPQVNEALQKMDAGQNLPAEETLARYLGTGPCSADAGFALPPSVRQKPNGAFDLGLTLFALGEHFGRRFGDEELGDGGSPREQELDAKRAIEAECALIITRAIAADRTQPPELRARAFYLAGNLEFLLKKYEDAVKEYDQALALIPGLRAADGGPVGDGIGRDAAWNRAIALRRIEDQKDAGNDAPDANDAPDSSPPDASDGGDGKDGSSGDDGGKGDAGKDGGDKGDGGKDDAGKDAGDRDDAGQDGGQDEDGGGSPPPPPPAASQSASPQQDSRILEMLEQQTPSYQEQEAKQRARTRRGRPTMEDK